MPRWCHVFLFSKECCARLNNFFFPIHLKVWEKKKNRKNKITKEPFQWKIIVWSCFQLLYLEKSFHVYILSIVRHNGKHIYIYEHAYIYTQKIICIYVYSYIYMFSIVLSYWKLFQRQSSTTEDIVPNGSPTYRDVNQSHQGHISFWVMGWLACTLQPVCFLQYIEGKKKKKKRERERKGIKE